MRAGFNAALRAMCALALALGIAGALLIEASFRSALDIEQTYAAEAYARINGALIAADEAQSFHSAAQVTETLYSISDTEPHIRGFSVTPAESSQDPALWLDSAAQACRVQGGFAIDGAPYALGFDWDISAVYSAWGEQIRLFRLSYCAAVLAAGAIAFIYAMRRSKRLMRVATAARAIAQGDTDRRAPQNLHGDAGLLAENVNAMADSLTGRLRHQDEFVANFTHELKTPLTSIIGYAELLRGGALEPDEQTEAVDYIFSEGRRLERMSLKLLDIFVADNSKLKLVKASPAKLARDAARQLRADYARAGIALNCDCEEGLCLLEPDLVRSLINNLLDNARKACNGGGHILLRVRMSEGGCVLEVRDDGVGIPRNALKHLTEAFYRVDKARSRELGGAGLGMTLCLKIARLHGGELRVSSTPGSGTSIVCTLNGGRV